MKIEWEKLDGEGVCRSKCGRFHIILLSNEFLGEEAFVLVDEQYPNSLVPFKQYAPVLEVAKNKAKNQLLKELLDEEEDEETSEEFLNRFDNVQTMDEYLEEEKKNG